MLSHLKKPTIPLTKKQFKSLLREELKKKYSGPNGFDIASVVNIYRELRNKNPHISLTNEEISKFINTLIEDWVIDLKVDIIAPWEVYFCFNE